MLSWNKTEISIDFQARSYQGRTMSLEIRNEDRAWKYDPLPVDHMTWNACIHLPCSVTLLFAGKKHDDTQVDEAGNIVHDMCVIIQDIRLDGISCWRHWPELGIVLEREDSDDILLGKHITANGRVDLPLQEANAMFWLVKSTLS